MRRSERRPYYKTVGCLVRILYNIFVTILFNIFFFVKRCIGTCAGMFTSEVQFGHAGSCAQSDLETAVAKNKSLAEAGAHVPESFDTLG